MEQNQVQCEALINKCKQEDACNEDALIVRSAFPLPRVKYQDAILISPKGAKQLAELAATRHKVHWTQSCFVSFCISVEDILCYGVRKRYAASKQLSSSGKILADVGKTFPVAAATFNKCYGVKSSSSHDQEDYVQLVTSTGTERRVLWLRVAIIESSLVATVNEIIKNAGKYYTDHSLLCHPVYGEVFGYLLDGPCSIRVSRLKIADSALTSPTPAEIVKRHNKVLSASMSKVQQDGLSQTGTEEAWDHVKSLYQTSAATCLFGKNNVHVQPAGFPGTLAGYLTLQRVIDSLQLKWIPNSLLKSTSNAASSLWDHVLSLDIGTQVAHIHCHRSGDSAQLTLIGYDGIAIPHMIFSHQPSLFLFLECLENNLLPRGCLEPPLWYIKDKTKKAKSSSWRPLTTSFPSSSEWGVGEGEEWWEGVDVWNQVFRLRFSGGKPEGLKLTSDPVVKGHVPHLPLNLSTLSSTHGRLSISPSLSSSSTTSSTRSSPSPPLSEEERPAMHSPFGITFDRPTSLARKDWEKFQAQVSKPLLARYFYCWLSHCRHMKKVRGMVAHMVDTSAPVQGENPANYRDGIVEELWTEFQANRNDASWSSLLRAVYIKGIPESLRPKIWPWLLGLYLISATDKETESVKMQAHESYHRELADWKKVEVIHLRLVAKAERERAERWRRECAANMSHTAGFKFGRERGGEGEEERRGEGEGEGEGKGEGEDGERVRSEKHEQRQATVESSVPAPLPSTDSSSTATPDLHNGHSHTHTPSHTPPSTSPHLTPSSPTSRSPSPEINTLSDTSIITQNTTSPFPSPQPTHSHTLPSHDYIISPQNDIAKKTRSSSIDSGHSSNSNLGNSIDTKNCSSLVNGCHDDSVRGDVNSSEDSKLVEWNGDGSSMDPRRDGEGSSEVVVTTVLDEDAGQGRDVGIDEGEGEGVEELDEKGQLFADELVKIDKDIPRCDRDYWFFKVPENLTKLRNLVSTYVWSHPKEGYSQGMCDLLAPLLVMLEDESLTYACYLCLMRSAIELFPPHTGMNTRLSNLKALLQVLEPDFFQYLSERPLGDGLFYCYRWFLVSFKREFEYDDVFRLWETWWAAQLCCSTHFLEFCGLAIMTQFKPAIMDSHMDSSDILNLFTDLADSKSIDCLQTITLAQRTIHRLVVALTIAPGGSDRELAS